MFASPAMAALDTSLTLTNDGPVTEGSHIHFTFVGTAAAVYDITVSPATAGGATAGQAAPTADYTGLPTTVTLDGSGNGSIDLTTVDDSLYEGNEQFTLTATNEADSSTQSSTATINDNDTAPSYSLLPASSTVAEAPGAAASITPTLSAVSGLDTVVTLSTVDGTAKAGSDYTALNQTVTIPAGHTTPLAGAVSIPVTNDNTTDSAATETFTVVGSATNVSSPVASAMVNITDVNTTPPALTLSVASPAVEGSSETFTVTANHKSDMPITVDWSSVAPTLVAGHGTATAGTDFTYPASGRTVTIAPGSLTTPITIPLTADTTYEPSEDFAIALANPTNATLGATTTVTGTITDNNAPSVTVTPTTTTEGDSGSHAVTFTATLSAVSANPVTASWTTVDGTAKAGKDYVAGSGTLTFPAGTTTQTFSVDVLGDTIDEPNETFLIRTSSTDTNLGVGDTTITITDDDAPPTVTFGDVTTDEGDGPNAILVPITLSNPSSNDITFTVADAGTGTASPTYSSSVVGSGDYTLLNTSVTIPAGMTTGYAVVLSNGDAIYEPDETVKLTATATVGTAGYLTAPTSRGATVTLTNDDNAPNLEINSVSGDEGDTVAVTGKVSGISQTATNLTVIFTGTATNGKQGASENDFTNPGATAVTIPAGTDPGTELDVAHVALTDDDAAEPAETILVSGYGAGNVGSVTNGVITINASDGGGENPGGPGGHPGHGGEVTISLPMKTIYGGKTLSITGTADADATVELWAAPIADDTLQKVAETKADGDGKYSFLRWIGQGYRLQAKSGDATSDEVTIEVIQSPIFIPGTTKGLLTLAVKGNPAAAGQTVIVQQLVKGKWVNTWRGTTAKDDMVWRTSTKEKSGTVMTLRAFVVGDLKNGIYPGYSSARKLTIK